MTEGCTRRCDGQSRAPRRKMDKAADSGESYEDDSLTDIQRSCALVRVLRAGLECGRAAQNAGARRIQDKQIIIVGRSSQRVAPKQIDSPGTASRCDRVERGASSKIVQPADFADRW